MSLRTLLTPEKTLLADGVAALTRIADALERLADVYAPVTAPLAEAEDPAPTLAGPTTDHAYAVIDDARQALTRSLGREPTDEELVAQLDETGPADWPTLRRARPTEDR